MHVPDGFLDLPTSLATGAIAAGAVGIALTKAAPELRRTGPALPGLLAAFIFAAQMINFPVGIGTSGHLMGGALAAVLVGPWTAVIVMAAVLLVQGLLFADGGLSAMGTNILLVGLITVLVGYVVAAALHRALPRGRAGTVAAASVGALVSVPVAAAVFVGLYAIGGTHPVPLGAMLTAMVGWHVLVGIGEAIITGAVVGAVLASRPDLVYLTGAQTAELLVVTDDGTRRVSATSTVTEDAPQARGATSLFAWGVSLTLLVAGGLSLIASSSPDGLESVAASLGFEEAAADSAVAAWPLADYGVAGVEGLWATSIAGFIGVAIVAALAYLALVPLARRRAASDTEAPLQPAAGHDRR